jgi:hypothetical protein
LVYSRRILPGCSVDVSGVIDRAREIALRRANSLREIKELLEQGKDQEALALGYI